MASARYIVQRRIDTTADADRLKQLLSRCDGVESTEACRNGVLIRYDACRWDYSTLVRVVEQAGCPVRRNWRQTVRAVLFAFMDRNARSHASAQGGACCSRPAGIYGVEDRTGGNKTR